MRLKQVLIVGGLCGLAIVPCYGFIQWTEMVSMRDGVELATEVYVPVTYLPPWETVLQRTPYDPELDSLLVLLVADVKGYAVVSQSLRGTGGSQGEPLLFATDAWDSLQDGYDTIEWVANQWWSNGEVGMIGASAPGMTQYLAAGALPPHLTCTAPVVAAHSMYHHCAYGGGEFRKALVETWLNDQGTPWLIDTVANHPNYDTLWQSVDLATRWGLVSTPMFHVSGWFDLYTDSQLEAFSALQAVSGNQKLFVGPWGHGAAWGRREQGDLTYPPNAAMSEPEMVLSLFRWYDYWLKDSSSAVLDPKVTYYLMGDVDSPDTSLWNHWVEADTWPPVDQQYVALYLREGGTLDTLPPQASEPPDTFVYDPQNPCPTIGGREFIGIPGGYGPKDQRSLEGRSDVLVYTMGALEQPLAVVGKLRLLLYASSDGYDTDWAARVTDVYPDRRSILMTDNILMARHRRGFSVEDSLTPGVPDTFDVDLWSTANVLNTGHSIRLIISSSNYPRFERNPNTGAPFQRNDPDTRIATNVVFHDASLPSAILLPTVPFEVPGVMEEEQLSSLCSRTVPSLQVVSFLGDLQVRLLLPRTDVVDLSLFDSAGRKAGDLWSGVMRSGSHHLSFEPDLPSGVYFVLLRTSGGGQASKKAVLLE